MRLQYYYKSFSPPHTLQIQTGSLAENIIRASSDYLPESINITPDDFARLEIIIVDLLNDQTSQYRLVRLDEICRDRAIRVDRVSCIENSRVDSRCS